ncbi:hypothetical protein [Poseidonocella sedimentorum]|uniref:Uncharacterized protein n=1 Tax=Poseidonocella sedimentorum TaxID=871652 RepID=A0A1I6E4V9_9RHOB|nr:hypothetical protein [Poseidonocella sedimentorum]SFR12591.1 hypothetical protein SAMN04515673_10786 [Poseidonocella sedimentorum]
MEELTLTPLIATLLFVLACLAGHRYRRVWKAEGPRWQLWLYGVVAAVCLMILGFVPLTA